MENIQVAPIGSKGKMVLIAPCGTYGDIAAPLALAIRLRELGYGVRTAAAEKFRQLFESRGFPFTAAGLDFQAELSSDDDAGKTGTRAQISAWGGLLRRELEIQADVLPALAADADIIIGSGLLLMGPSVAELRGIPYRQICHLPQAFPSDLHAPYIFQHKRRPRFANRLLWALDRKYSRMFTAPLIDAQRRRIGLGKIPEYDAYFAHRVILSVDRALYPADPGLTEGNFRTGYWQLPPSAPALDPELSDFIDSGAAPIYVGFGSMPAPARDAVLRALKMLITAGHRIVLGAGLGDFYRSLDPRSCFPATSVDHQLLFTRVAACVHHGGAGTTYTAARFGLPQVIVPFIMDQFFWAQRVAELGIGRSCAGKPTRLAERLTGTVAAVVGNPGYRERAGGLSGRIENESALAEAVRIVEEALSGGEGREDGNESRAG